MAKKGRKPSGEGAGPYKLPNGSWQVAVTVGYTSTGKRIRKTATRKKRADAAAALRKLLSERDRGVLSAPDRMTVREYLEAWMKTRETSVRERTKSVHRNVLKHHIDGIGRLRLVSLTQLHVEEWMASLAENKVPITTQRQALITLSTAMRKAVERGLIVANPCQSVPMPAHQPKKIQPFTVEEVKAILDATKDDPMHAAYVLAFHTGLRVSEMLGLQWRDIEGDTLQIRRQVVDVPTIHLAPPKTETSSRDIVMTVRCVDALRERRKWAMANGYAGNEMIFPTLRGKIYRPCNWMRVYWIPLLKALDIEHRGFHHTRHTFATHALRAGTPVHIVSRMLGHSRVSITLDTYAHLITSDQHEAAKTVQRLFG